MRTLIGSEVGDSSCRVDLEGVHDVVRVARRFRCQACGWPAMWWTSLEVWIVIRPFLIFEEPW